MDIMIFPSKYEGFGTTVLEAQCNGLPTLASDVLPIETRVTSCIDYLSIKNDSYYKWAQKALQMVNNIERKDRTNEIKMAGYDIIDTYKILSDFYLGFA